MNYVKEFYQDYENYTVYNLFKKKGKEKMFLYRITESKIKTKLDKKINDPDFSYSLRK